MKRRSVRRARQRRAAVVDAVRCGGPTCASSTAAAPAACTSPRDDRRLTELAAGSGLYAPTLFDGYDDFDPEPAASFAAPVVRRPAPGYVTAYGGGYVASGPPGWSRVPTPGGRAGSPLVRTEGAGEVQTPLRGAAADGLRIGDRVWFRHAKAGELCERFDAVHLVRGRVTRRRVPTYRGEGKNFG